MISMKNVVVLILCVFSVKAGSNYREHCEFSWCSHECQKKGNEFGGCYFNHITGKTECKCDSRYCTNAKCDLECQKHGYHRGYCPDRDFYCVCSLKTNCDADTCSNKCRSTGGRDGGFCSLHSRACVCHQYD